MPFNSISVDGDGARTLVTNFLPCDKPTLVGLSAICTSLTAEHMTNHVTIGISKDDASPLNVLLVLAQGWVDAQNKIGWTGKLQLEPDMGVFVHLRSSGSNTIKLNLATEI